MEVIMCKWKKIFLVMSLSNIIFNTNLQATIFNGLKTANPYFFVEIAQKWLDEYEKQISEYNHQIYHEDTRNIC